MGNRFKRRNEINASCSYELRSPMAARAGCENAFGKNKTNCQPLLAIYFTPPGKGKPLHVNAIGMSTSSSSASSCPCCWSVVYVNDGETKVQSPSAWLMRARSSAHTLTLFAVRFLALAVALSYFPSLSVINGWGIFRSAAITESF